MNEDQQFLTDTLLACCDRLDDIEQAPLAYLNDVCRVCALLRPMVADAGTPEQIVLANLVYRTEEWVATWVLRGRYSEQDLPAWLLGDSEADFVAWTAARVEYEQLVP